MEDKQLTTAESIALIGRMIENTRRSMERNAGRQMLIWGYVTIAVTLAVCAASYYDITQYINYIWLGIPIIATSISLLTKRKTEQGHVLSFVDKTIIQLWCVVGGTMVLLSIATILGLYQIPILFVIVLLFSIGSTITGLVTRFSASIYSGILAIIASPFLLISSGYWQPVIFIAFFAILSVIPGHILNYHSNNQKDRG